MYKNILITGASGMLGSCLYEELFNNTDYTLLTPSHKELDILSKDAVNKYFKSNNVNIVLHCAAIVGGILRNKNNQEEFLQKNIQMQDNIINASFDNECELYFMSSSCCYPKECPQPMAEEYFFEGEPEPTNRGYAIAKRDGVKKINVYNKISHMDRIIKGINGSKFRGLSLNLCNLYGKEKHFDAINSHVIPAIFKKISDANGDVELLGSGNAEREFLYAPDAARMIREIIEKRIIDKINMINVGSGVVISIKNLVEIIRATTDFKYNFIWSGKDDGMNKKQVDLSMLLSYGINPNSVLNHLPLGISMAYLNFKDNQR